MAKIKGSRAKPKPGFKAPRRKVKAQLSSEASAPHHMLPQEGQPDVYWARGIVDDIVREGRRLYRVRWWGYLAEADTWEPAEHLKQVQLDDYMAALQALGKHLD